MRKIDRHVLRALDSRSHQLLLDQMEGKGAVRMMLSAHAFDNLDIVRYGAGYLCIE